MPRSFVIFDLVATVVDAGPRYIEAYRLVCNKYGFTPPKDQIVLDMLGEFNLGQIIDATLPKMEKGKKSEFMQACNVACDTLLIQPDWKECLFPGIPACFEALKNKDVELGLVSGIRQDALLNQCGYHRLNRFMNPEFLLARTPEIDQIQDHADLKTHLLTTLKKRFNAQFGEDPSQLVYVGDTPVDLEAANQAGMKFVGVAWTARQFDKLHAAGCDTIVRDFGDLQGTILRSLGKTQAIKLDRGLPSLPVVEPVLVK
jgi:pyrophosphatase PpaX